jgi:hypothetical protein
VNEFFLTEPGEDKSKPKEPKKVIELEDSEIGRWVKAWVKGHTDTEHLPSLNHPFIGSVTQHYVNRSNHVHMEVTAPSRHTPGEHARYMFCDAIGYEYEVIDPS